MGGWFKKRINTIADYKGLKMRISGLGSQVIARAGATPVLTPADEVYNAFERGVIDAGEWVGPHDDLKLNLQNTARYYYYPGWHEPGTVAEFGFNKKAYEALPADLRRILDLAATAVQVHGFMDFQAKNVIAVERLRTEFKGKVELVQLPAPVLRDLKKLATQVIKEHSERAPWPERSTPPSRSSRRSSAPGTTWRKAPITSCPRGERGTRCKGSEGRERLAALGRPGRSSRAGRAHGPGAGGPSPVPHRRPQRGVLGGPSDGGRAQGRTPGARPRRGPRRVVRHPVHRGQAGGHARRGRGLVRSGVDLLFTSQEAATLAARDATKSVPIVFTSSHELRTPLNAVIGVSEVLAEGMFGDLNDKQAEYLQDILQSGRHLLSLINDILDLSKIEAGRMELERADFDLPSAIDNALLLMRERASRKDIAVGRAIDDRLGILEADERKVKQVLLNLLSNALKFTPEGGRIDVRAELRDGVAEISVADTGVGIAPEDQQAVFEEFRQVGSAAKRGEGTGLGLALSRKFVELHGGRIWVTSEMGQGSTFAFTIPVRPED